MLIYGHLNPLYIHDIPGVKHATKIFIKILISNVIKEAYFENGTQEVDF